MPERPDVVVWSALVGGADVPIGAQPAGSESSRCSKVVDSVKISHYHVVDVRIQRIGFQLVKVRVSAVGDPLSSNWHLLPERTQRDESKTGDCLFNAAKCVYRLIGAVRLDYKPRERFATFQRFKEP